MRLLLLSILATLATACASVDSGSQHTPSQPKQEYEQAYSKLSLTFSGDSYLIIKHLESGEIVSQGLYQDRGYLEIRVNPFEQYELVVGYPAHTDIQFEGARIEYKNPKKIQRFAVTFDGVKQIN